MTTLEGNKLIAGFMGHKISYGLQNVMLVSTEEITYTPAKYHSSWDWLMPVVEKIETFEQNEHDAESGYIMTLTGYSCCIENMLGGSISEGYERTKIGSVWQAVVQFIQWYNSQSKTDNNDKY